MDIETRLKEYGFTKREIDINPELAQIVKDNMSAPNERAMINRLKISVIKKDIELMEPAYFKIKLMKEGYSLKRIESNPALIEKRREKMIYDRTKRYRKNI